MSGAFSCLFALRAHPVTGFPQPEYPDDANDGPDYAGHVITARFTN